MGARPPSRFSRPTCSGPFRKPVPPGVEPDSSRPCKMAWGAVVSEDERAGRGPRAIEQTEDSMSRCRWFLVMVALPVLGCALPSKLESLRTDHPASRDAPEAPRSASPPTLREEPQDEVRSRSVTTGGAHKGRDQTAAPAVGNGRGSPPPDPGGGPRPSGPAAPIRAHGSYACPRHQAVVRQAPGTCPECGMKLVEKKGEPE